MFERKNQNVLSKHYNALLEQSGSESDADDFITLKRADHDLDSTIPQGPPEQDLSKRKLKLGKAKRAMAKFGARNTKLVFDDEGEGHDAYEIADEKEFYAGGEEAVKEAERQHLEAEAARMGEARARDREEAKEKKREKKRKRKEREKVSRIDAETCQLAYPDYSRWKLVIMRPQVQRLSGQLQTWMMVMFPRSLTSHLRAPILKTNPSDRP
jgi:ATP-dependent RNA helicase DDX10/DBP4